jgi:hypothetical protein
MKRLAIKIPEVMAKTAKSEIMSKTKPIIDKEPTIEIIIKPEIILSSLGM